MRFLVSIGLVLIAVLGASARVLHMDDDPCAVHPNLPCIRVPSCDKGDEKISEFWENTAAGFVKPLNSTAGVICHDDDGIQITLAAAGTEMGSTSTQCMDNVWEHGAVLESFIAPVSHPKLNPKFYWELDATPNNVLWAGLIENTKIAGLDNNCPVCENGAGHLDCTGKAEYNPPIPSVATKLAKGWANKLTVPWAMFPCAVRATPYFRANFYRYGASTST